MLLGATERLEFVDAPGHAGDLERYRARGYAMRGNRIAVRVAGPASADDLADLHLPSRRGLDLSGLAVEYYPPRPLPGAG